MWQIYIPSWLIPASMAWVGSVCLGIALVLVLMDMPGGVNWSRIGAVFALIGGFGALGGAAGWIGEHLLWGQQRAMSLGQQWGGRLIGGGIIVVLLFTALAWTWKHVAGSGIKAGGKGAVSKRVRSLFKAGALAMVGASVATLLSPLYTLLDSGISHLHTFLV